MQKNKNKASFIFYFIFGLIVFSPTALHAEQPAEQAEKPIIEKLSAQDSGLLLVLTARSVRLGEEHIVLPITIDIPAPIAVSKEAQTQMGKSGDELEGGEK